MSEFNLLDILWERASIESADFVEEHLGEALVFLYEHKFFHFVIQKTSEQKIEGFSFCFWAQRRRNDLTEHFDCTSRFGEKLFRSLAYAWKGNHPVKVIHPSFQLPQNIYHVDDFFKEYPVSKIPPVRLIHIEGGTSEVAETILKGFEKHLKPGVLILLGELIGYPNWRNGQYRAWKKIAKDYGVKFRYLGFCDHQALVEITKRQAPSTEAVKA